MVCTEASSYLQRESIIRCCTMSYCRSSVLEAVFFLPPTRVASLSLKVFRLRPTASSATLWGTSSSAQCWRGLASAAICPNCTLSSRCQAHTWERCTTTAHWSAQVRATAQLWGGKKYKIKKGTLQMCCIYKVLCSSASRLSSKNIIHLCVA